MISKKNIKEIVLSILWLKNIVTVFISLPSDIPGGSIAKEKGPRNSTTPAPSTEPPAGPWGNLRLPDYIAPSHYDLHMEIDPNKDTFSGSEEIVINITKETPTVLLHSNGLDIMHVEIKDSKKGMSFFKETKSR